MTGWWQALSGADQVLWGLAVFSTVFFLLQTVFTFLGLDQDGDLGEADAETESPDDLTGFRYFSVRNMVAFFLGFSWVALSCRQFGIPVFLAALAGMLGGIGFVAASFYVMQTLARLKSDGTLVLENAVGKEARVSLTVPGERQGRGKVMVALQGRLVELEAETEGPALKRNQRVFVLQILDGNSLLVGD